MIGLFECMQLQSGSLLEFTPDGRYESLCLYERCERGVMGKPQLLDQIRSDDKLWTVLETIIDRDHIICIAQLCSSNGAKGWICLASDSHPGKGPNLIRHNFEIIE